ncbi:hypothetical protein [Planctomicrobium sp. SH664]|uniref:hypothetical protein n=1 Tax=Planctomicrobium sp. SH664 TaxID=3448125 RepID=UPI003F5AFCAF
MKVEEMPAEAPLRTWGPIRTAEYATTETNWNYSIGETSEVLECWDWLRDWRLIIIFESSHEQHPSENSERSLTVFDAVNWLKANRYGIPNELCEGPDPSRPLTVTIDGRLMWFDPSTAVQRWGPSIFSKFKNDPSPTLYLSQDGTWIHRQLVSVPTEDPFDVLIPSFEDNIAILTDEAAVDWFIEQGISAIPPRLERLFFSRSIGMSKVLVSVFNVETGKFVRLDLTNGLEFGTIEYGEHPKRRGIGALSARKHSGVCRTEPGGHSRENTT